MIRLRLRNRAGEVVAEALIDDEDAALASYGWVLNSNGYAWRSIMGGRRHVYLHREVLGLERGDGRQADHINRDRLDNRRSNLRVVTPGQNRQNTPPLGGTSRFRGVSWDRARHKWIASVQVNRRHHYVGRFTSEADAATAVAEARRRLMPYSEERPTPWAPRVEPSRLTHLRPEKAA